MQESLPEIPLFGNQSSTTDGKSIPLFRYICGIYFPQDRLDSCTSLVLRQSAGLKIHIPQENSNPRP
jgi:hypothetical protein